MKLFKSMICVLCAAWTTVALAQGVTTANLTGDAVDSNNQPLPGVVINGVHEPTGTRYSAVTRADGRYDLRNVRVGGPYTITATMPGFKTQQRNNLFLKLGETQEINFQMTVDAVEETLVVVADTNALINPGRQGAASNVSEEAIEKLPTVNRAISDFARTNPYFQDYSEGGASTLSVAGRNNRYNSILIDGAVNNDLFGLSASGAPGGQAEAQPVSLEAIQEIQLLVSPYDIRQGGFSGGGVNAITKSGTNDLSGSLFHYFKTDSQFGEYVLPGGDIAEFGEYDETQTGFSVGGPIIKDKAFFFVSAESRRKEVPTGVEIRQDGTSGTGQNFGFFDEAQEFVSILRDQYGYDPGGLDEITRNTDSDTIFVRFDFNIGDAHQLTVRHNYVDAENDRIAPDLFAYNFPGNAQFFPNETNSTVVQLNSSFGGFYNEFRLSYQTIKDRRTGVGDPFPWVEIENIDPDNNFPNDQFPGRIGDEFEAGTERFSTRNALDQDILEITNDLTFFMGAHTITVGTHNELFSFDNLFIRENFGAYQFDTLEDFRNGWARQYDYSFSATDDPLESAKFDAQQLGFYAGDQWTVSPSLTVTLGLRLDVPLFPDEPTNNPIMDSFQWYEDNPIANPNAQLRTGGLSTTNTPDGNLLWSPRAGFNWDVTGDGSRQLRGGLGIFSGRTPYVWLSNQYSNTGIEFTRVRASVRGVSEDNHIPFNPDPFNQPESIEGVRTFTNEIDVIDPDFELPQVFRTNLAYDHDLGFWGMVASAEVIYSKNMNEILYQNLNIVPERNDDGSIATAFDGRPMWERQDNGLSDVIYLTNTSEGDQLSLNVKLERPFRDGLYWFVSYLYNSSESVNDGTSSQAFSNWRFVPNQGNPNEPETADSRFGIEDRFTASVAYDFQVADKFTLTVSGYYNAQSGRAYSNIFNGDVNGDGQFSNDLLYVPASMDEVEWRGPSGLSEQEIWNTFVEYVEADGNLEFGQIAERNASRAPWIHQLDISFALKTSFSRYRVQAYLDIFNVANLLDDEDGLHEYVNFNTVQPIRYRGENDEGKPIYDLQITNPDNRFTIDDIRSRWQGQFGIRFSF
ncbi:TonB-dependent receptor [Sulfidibacter corallicola]|uniref:TonB-dependent receptor n=1 Tax=Sulfidibacter corallicola TaxID=2818388 RepID=A0A8A4TIB9_SULCO|nr:TonB-dependent receptor [Sulfidibacter corallicola]QTD49363.1 TonB-dependent receptor [Sulfidibacter corallicola]